MYAGQSVPARYMEALGKDALFPESGYEGAYIKDIAKDLVEEQRDILDDADWSPFKEINI